MTYSKECNILPRIHHLLSEFPDYKHIQNDLTSQLLVPKDMDSSPLVIAVIGPKDTLPFLHHLGDVVGHCQSAVIHYVTNESPALHVVGELQNEFDSYSMDVPHVVIIEEPLNHLEYDVVGIPLHGFFDNVGWPYSSSVVILHIDAMDTSCTTSCSTMYNTQYLREHLWNDPSLLEVVPAFYSRITALFRKKCCLVATSTPTSSKKIVPYL
jgi:hypothetical protein